MHPQNQQREIKLPEIAGAGFGLTLLCVVLRFFSRDRTIPEYFISLAILSLGLCGYPLFFRGRVNFLMKDGRLWRFPSYALAVCFAAIISSLFNFILLALMFR